MNHNDDPRITAYVLGELPAADQAAFESVLASDPALRAEVEAYRGLAARLETELHAEACPALDPAKRERLLVAPPPVVVRSWRNYLFAATSIAAGFVMAFLTLLPFGNSDKGKSVNGMNLALDKGAVPAEDYSAAGGAMAMLMDEPTPKVKAYKKRLAAEASAMKEFRADCEGARKQDADECLQMIHMAPMATATKDMSRSNKLSSSVDGKNARIAAVPSAAPAPLVMSPSAGGPPTSPPVVLRKINSAAQPIVTGYVSDQTVLRSTKSAPRAKVMMHDGHAEKMEGATMAAADFAVAAEEKKSEIGVGGEAWRANDGEWNRDKFANDLEQRFTAAQVSPLSTFSADVDTASYTLLRRSLSRNSLPVPASVRIEEMVNYFDYAYPQPKAPHPVAVAVDASVCPWATGHQLVRIGIQGKMVGPLERPPYNLVFLIDCSGSMSSPDKLPLLKECFLKLVEQLDERDNVGIVVYAGASGTVAEPTQCTLDGKKKLVEAIVRLQPGGCTNGASGLKGAYDLARKNLKEKAVNRVILATDGDFNVGTTDNGALVELVKQESAGKVFLTVLGFGEGNLNDSLMQEISGKGNGNNYYIDSLSQGERVLCQRLVGTVVTIAKDVKIQVDFNPAQVHSYRLLGYDNRRLANEDFNDDTKDAGEMGAGHTVTAFYEVIPVGAPDVKNEVDAPKYSLPASPAGGHDELLTVKVRYQPPQGGKSTLIETPVKSAAVKKFSAASPDFTFATSVAAAGLVLRQSQFKGGASLDAVLEWLTIPGVVGDNADRQEFRKLMEAAKRSMPPPAR